MDLVKPKTGTTMETIGSIGFVKLNFDIRAPGWA